MYNWLLDKSVYFSFDRSGYERHAKKFDEIDPELFKNKNILITGGTSGIGEALALRLIKAKSNVTVTGRAENKFNESSLKDIASFYSLDMANFDEVQKFCDKADKYDHIVCNAGGMPSELKIINNLYDSIFASQVVGHYKLIDHLHRHGKITKDASIHFNSSGGMYLMKLDLSDLTWETKKYDKVASYAIAKRAQIIITQELPKLYPDYYFSCSHPGWVGTAAVKEAIPGFYSFTNNRLRNSDQGADTMYWALAQGSKIKNGAFYFDRMEKDPYALFWTKESEDERKKLMELITL